MFAWAGGGGMAQNPPAENTEEESLRPEDVHEQYSGEEAIEQYGGESSFRQLFVPKTRALVLDVLVGERGDALTAQEIANHHEDLSVSGFNRHREALLDFGVIVEAGKRGNAMTYALNRRHPVTQLLVMVDDVTMWGQTQLVLEEQFLTESDTPTTV